MVSTAGWGVWHMIGAEGMLQPTAYGIYSSFRDPSGNHIRLTKSRKRPWSRDPAMGRDPAQIVVRVRPGNRIGSPRGRTGGDPSLVRFHHRPMTLERAASADGGSPTAGSRGSGPRWMPGLPCAAGPPATT